MRRHELRRRALQALFQVDVGKTDIQEAIDHVLEGESDASDSDVRYVTKLVRGTRDHIEEIDALLSERVQNWRLDRMAKVDLNVLRMATYELCYEHDVDVATIVDEAVEVAKAFSTNESGKFVNGVLAKILPVAEARRANTSSQ